jgi:valyl-tRNA synthetase
MEGISFADTAPANSAQVLVRNTLVCLPLEGVIDLAAERARLAKELAKVQSEAEKIEARLANPKFMAGAKDEAIEENRARLDEALPQIEKLKAALERLAG